MIVVIADDISGSSEIGGIGLAYGLKVELQRGFCSESEAELLIIDTDTRSLSHKKAGQVIRDVARNIKTSGLPIEWIYKKTDSVLRGPVGSELKALQDVMCVSRVLLVPANPSKGRIVRNGSYFINEKLLSETDFVNDPECPAITSIILEFPAFSGSSQIHLMKSNQVLSGEGIIVGQAETTGDLSRWSEQMDEQTIMAGAGEFFEAILSNKRIIRKKMAEKPEFRLKNKALFVCGSSSDSSRQALRKPDRLGVKVCRMPEGLFRTPQSGVKFFQQWSDEIIESFENGSGVIITIDREVVRDAEFAGKLRSVIAQVVLAVSQRVSLTEFFVEGGATASEIVDCFGWKRFEPCDQLCPGVVRMRVLESSNIYLTIKPGSYPWPKRMWEKAMFETF